MGSNKKFCSVPWKELTFGSQNQYAVCCKWDENKNIATSSSTKSREQHWNGEQLRNLRKRFIAGESIPECNWCWKDEEKNKVSSRMRRNQHYYGQSEILINDPVIKETLEQTDAEGNYDIKNVEGLFVSTGDKCQLRCIHCSPAYSRSILKDYKKLSWDNNFKSRRRVQFNFDSKTATKKHWQQMEKTLSTIKVIRVTGGEPSIDENFIKLLKFCNDNGFSKDIDIFIATNLVTLQPKFKELLKHFRQATLMISLDGTADLEEYIRWPTNWNRKVKNIKDISNHLKISVNTTVNSLNILRLHEIIDWVDQYKILHNIEILEYPASLQLCHLPEKLKSKCIDTLKSYIPSTEKFKLTDNYERISYRSQCIESVIKTLMIPGDLSKQKELAKIVKGYDSIRKTKLSNIIPELGFLDNI